MSYFLFYCNDDGSHVKYFENKENIISHLEEFFSDEPIVFLDQFPEDLTYIADNEVFVIKGEIVLPQSTEVVKTYDLD